MENLKVTNKLRRKIYPFEYLMSVFLLVNTLRDLYLAQKVGNSHIENTISDSNNLRTLGIWLILFILKIKQEGTKLNVLISLISTLNLALLKATQYENKYLIISHVFFIILYIYTLIKYPVYSLPDPQGSHKVGLKQMRIQDEFQTEISVYYPCLDKNQKHRYMKWSPGIQYWRSMYESMRFGSFVIPKFIFSFFMNFVDKIFINCFPNADIISQSSYKVIIFSHGLAAHRQAYSSYLMDLASKGYVIFSPNHYEEICPYDIMQAIKNKNEVIPKQIRGKHLHDRQTQIENLLKVITNKQMMNKLFETNVNLDTDNIVLMGHSFGGVTAAQTGMENPKFKALVCLDPWLYPQKDSILNKQYKNPILIINTETFAVKNEYYKLTEKCKEIFDASGDKVNNKMIGMYLGTDHVTQGDICFIIPTESEQIKMVRTTKNLLEVTQGQRYLISEFLSKMVFSNTKNQKQAKQDIMDSINKFTQQHYQQTNQFKLLFE